MTASSSNKGASDDMSADARREANRVSAMKSRARRKQQQLSLEKDLARLQEENTRLKERISQYEYILYFQNAEIQRWHETMRYVNSGAGQTTNLQHLSSTLMPNQTSSPKREPLSHGAVSDTSDPVQPAAQMNLPNVIPNLVAPFNNSLSSTQGSSQVDPNRTPISDDTNSGVFSEPSSSEAISNPPRTTPGPQTNFSSINSIPPLQPLAHLPNPGGLPIGMQGPTSSAPFAFPQAGPVVVSSENMNSTSLPGLGGVPTGMNTTQFMSGGLSKMSLPSFSKSVLAPIGEPLGARTSSNFVSHFAFISLLFMVLPAFIISLLPHSNFSFMAKGTSRQGLQLGSSSDFQTDTGSITDSIINETAKQALVLLPPKLDGGSIESVTKMTGGAFVEMTEF